MTDEQSIIQQIRTRVLNVSLGPWVRAIDLVLAEYQPRSRDPEVEADYVTKLSLLLMLSHFYDEDQICLLLESTELALPKTLEHATQRQLRRLLRGPRTDTGSDPDPDAPPGDESDGSKLPG